MKISVLVLTKFDIQLSFWGAQRCLLVIPEFDCQDYLHYTHRTHTCTHTCIHWKYTDLLNHQNFTIFLTLKLPGNRAALANATKDTAAIKENKCFCWHVLEQAQPVSRIINDARESLTLRYFASVFPNSTSLF